MTPLSLLLLSPVAIDADHASATPSAGAMIVAAGYVGQAQLSTMITASQGSIGRVNGRYYIAAPAATVFSAEQSLRFANPAMSSSGRSVSRTALGLQAIPAGGLTTLDVGLGFKVPADIPPGAYDGILAVVVNFD